VTSALHPRRTHASGRIAAHTEREEEWPLWKQVLLLYGAIFVLAVVLTTACFIAAHAAA
jgi:hypothetical protein